MADRYQNRPFAAADDYDRGDTSVRAESDPLAELARLIGQADPFGTPAKAPQPLQSRANVRPSYEPVREEVQEDEATAPAGPPPWMQRARQEAPPAQEPAQEDEDPEYQPSPVHPLHRYATGRPAAIQNHPVQNPPVQNYPAQDYYEAPQTAEHEHEAIDPSRIDPSRYDDALYGRIESGEQEYQRDPAYPDDPYAYQNEYEEAPEPRRRASGMVTVAAVLALAVVGTGAAYAYRTYVGTPRSGEPPIIKADNSPTKIVPAPADGVAKTPDRMLSSDGGEKIVSREEAPVDVNSKAGPRIAYPPLNQNGNPPPIASVTTAAPPPATAANGTMPNSEPRKIKTLAVKGDAAENSGVPAGVAAPAKPAAARTPAAQPAPVAAPRNPASANASANTPLSLSPQGGAQPDPASAPTRTASTNPAQATTNPAPASGGGYVVQVSSQKNEADAQASYKALQTKFPSVLGSHSSLVKRVDLGEKGVYYRAFAGPFASADEAVQVCTSLKAAGGQCFVQRN